MPLNNVPTKDSLSDVENHVKNVAIIGNAVLGVDI